MAHVFVTRQLPGDALERLRAPSTTSTSGRATCRPPPTELRERAAERRGPARAAHRPHRRRAARRGARAARRSPTTPSAPTTSTSRPRPARGIPVGITPDVLTDATADLAFALLLAAGAPAPSRRAAAVRDGTLAHVGAAAAGSAPTSPARRSPIVGAGRIGEAVARRAAGFDMEVLDASAATTTCTPLLEPRRLRLAARPAHARDHATSSTPPRSRAMKPDGDPRQHRARRRRRPGRAGRARCTTARSPAPRSTSPTPSRCRPTTRCCRRPTSSSLPHIGSATTRRARAMADAGRRQPARRARRASRMPHPAPLG